ncbi:biotin transporter BioY [Amnibacterium kyonggiense]|uniref:Biotin transporter n=1 Tax=Amnibacterium kyonggiense TaxID=595671 RepID=A0A4R7FLT7_9MICO|nr:biotin transporter BioY [Amnibacterium kyonggiense]TDS77367.1 biotin transport system substrate-specific component [Amnibacterium kyonggiense]
MSLSLAPSRPVLADRVLPAALRLSKGRSLATDAALVVGGAALTAALAQLYIPMWPIPMTGQTFAVLLVGTVLGSLRGSLSMALYLVAGVLGAPVFAEHTSGSLFALTSGGFIIGFIAAAALVGWLAQREWDRRVVGTVVSFAAGTVVMYAFGLPWLAVSLGDLGPAVWHDFLHFDSLGAAVWGAGVAPFLVGDVVKAVVAGLLLPAAWKGVSHLRSR